MHTIPDSKVRDGLVNRLLRVVRPTSTVVHPSSQRCNLRRRLRSCVDAAGGHLEHSLRQK